MKDLIIILIVIAIAFTVVNSGEFAEEVIPEEPMPGMDQVNVNVYDFCVSYLKDPYLPEEDFYQENTLRFN
tara:strand:+ start:2574 stop:2786 length:213 start_codon:yes stop_codon:yes gene_type:complete